MILLTCDAPDCTSSTPAVATLGRVAAPIGWWLQQREESFIVACCDAHLALALLVVIRVTENKSSAIVHAPQRDDAYDRPMVDLFSEPEG